VARAAVTGGRRATASAIAGSARGARDEAWLAQQSWGWLSSAGADDLLPANALVRPKASCAPTGAMRHGTSMVQVKRHRPYQARVVTLRAEITCKDALRVTSAGRCWPCPLARVAPGLCNCRSLGQRKAVFWFSCAQSQVLIWLSVQFTHRFLATRTDPPPLNQVLDKRGRWRAVVHLGPRSQARGSCAAVSASFCAGLSACCAMELPHRRQSGSRSSGTPLFLAPIRLTGCLGDVAGPPARSLAGVATAQAGPAALLWMDSARANLQAAAVAGGRNSPQ